VDADVIDLEERQAKAGYGSYGNGQQKALQA
jgi:hypothetical protein